MAKRSNYKFQLKGTLLVGASTVAISNDLELDEVVSFTDEACVLRNRNKTIIERVRASASGGTLTLLKRGMENDSEDEDSDLEQERREGTICYMTILGPQIADTLKYTPFQGGMSGGSFATTAARDAALGGNGAALYPYTGVYVEATDLHYSYRMGTNQREEEDTGTATPNASGTQTGSVRLSDAAQHTAGTTDESGNPLVPQSDVIQASIQAGEAIYATTVTAVYAPGYMTGGASAQSNAVTRAAVTNGSFRVTVDGTAYNVDAINFTGDASMSDVAATIQTALRAATSGTETVVRSTDHFVITSGSTASTSAISVLTTSTGTVGTDISGVGTAWMDSETGRGTATAAVLASYTLNFTPAITAYTAGMNIRFLATAANAGALAVTVEALGSKDIKTLDGNDPQAGALRAGQVVSIVYDGTDMVMQNEDFAGTGNKGIIEVGTTIEQLAYSSQSLAVTPEGLGLAITGKPLTAARAMNTASGTQTVAHGFSKIPKGAVIFGIVENEMNTRSHGCSNGSINYCVYFGEEGNSGNVAQENGVNTSNAIYLKCSAGTSLNQRSIQSATITFDATNVNIVRTKSSNGTESTENAQIVIRCY